MKKKEEQKKLEVYANELNKIEDSSNYGGPLIPVYENNVITPFYQNELLNNFTKDWNPNNDKKQYISDMIPIDSLSEEDYIIKGYTVEKGFELQVKTMISNTLQFMYIKYANMLKSNSELNNVIKNIVDYANSFDDSYLNIANVDYTIDNVFNPIHILLQLGCGNNMYSPNLKIDPIYQAIFKITSYITQDVTILTDFTTMITSLIYNELNKSIYEVLTSILLFDEKSDDMATLSYLLNYLIESYISDINPMFYNIFSKAFVIAQNYNEYIIYKALK